MRVLALVLSAALLAAADLPSEYAGLEAEGTKWFNEAGKADLSTTERNDARKKAWVNLYRAKEILDAHWEAHPGDQDRIEDRLMNVGKMVFWIKKESPIGLLEGTGVGPKSGGTVKRDWGEKPPEEKPAPEGKPPAEKPAPEAKPAEPPKAAKTFDQEYAEAEAWRRSTAPISPGSWTASSPCWRSTPTRRATLSTRRPSSGPARAPRR